MMAIAGCESVKNLMRLFFGAYLAAIHRAYISLARMFVLFVVAPLPSPSLSQCLPAKGKATDKPFPLAIPAP